MAGRETANGEPEVPRSIDAEAGINLLLKQIEEAKKLLDNRPIKSADHTAWNNTTREYLIKVFGSRSPNIHTILHAPGEGAVWLGMPDHVYENYQASSIENKIGMLNSCVVWLKSKSQMSSEEKSRIENFNRK
jgi:hypothetical protein